MLFMEIFFVNLKVMIIIVGIMISVIIEIMLAIRVFLWAGKLQSTTSAEANEA